MEDDVFSRASHCLQVARPESKLEAVEALLDDWRRGLVGDELAEGKSLAIPEPGVPEGLRLVPPTKVPKRKLGSRRGQVAFFHAVAHIEYTAINLALDAVARFASMPTAFRDDWLRIAAEEVAHFRLVRALLHELGADYGQLPAHGGIWEMATNTRDDPMKRMALVPRVLEAHGLDVTPAMIDRFEQMGQRQAVGVLRVIYREEIGHVKAGTRWFRYECDQRGLPPDETFLRLVSETVRLPLRGAVNRSARSAAGFSEQELRGLTGQ